mgnify:CR=1 FL=1|jgi:hypothetical protein
MADKRYPMLWQRGLIQARVRARAGHCCEACGMQFIEGTNLSVNLYRGRKMIGTVHHIDEDKQNCSMANLVFLCQSCHYTIHCLNWRVGDVLPLKWADNPPRWIVDRGIAYKPHPQLSLLDRK